MLLFCILETHYNVLFFVSLLCCFCLHITEYEQIRGGGTKFSWAQGHKIPKYGPGYMYIGRSLSYSEVVPVYAMDADMLNIGIAPPILKRGCRRMWVVRLADLATLWPQK